MRLLHTSDWHLGRPLHGQPLLETQARFVDFLVEVVRDQHIDAVLVAGDVYDRAIPTVEAVELFDQALAQLAALDVPLVIISGNHDSAGRLGFGSGLFRGAGVHLRTEPGVVAPVLLTDEHGPVAVYPIPYLEPELTWSALEAVGPRHDAVITAAMQRVRADVAVRAPGTRSVVVAHAFVGNLGEAELSASERDITVGGSAIVPAAVFDGVDYVALGHLHGFQRPIADRVTYSGSPVAYSFSEARSVKSVSVVELDAAGAVTLERIPCPVVRPLACVTGTLDSFLTDPSWSEHEDHWLSVTLTDHELPTEPMGRLRERFSGVLQLTVVARRSGSDGSYQDRFVGLDDLGMANRFVADMRHRAPTDDESSRFRAAFEALRVEAAAA
ncbi:MAG: exonuclease SbcCD subunit D, partial [Acidimicrobiia bacterium]